jgi:hypothetical protein
MPWVYDDQWIKLQAMDLYERACGMPYPEGLRSNPAIMETLIEITWNAYAQGRHGFALFARRYKEATGRDVGYMEVQRLWWSEPRPSEPVAMAIMDSTF